MEHPVGALVPVALLLACAGPESGARDLPARLAAIERAVEEQRQSLNVPGAAVVVVRNDSVVLSRGFGLRDVEAELPVTPRTLFAIGSCTKPFTALAAVISADQGLLSLDDPPRKFLPYFRLRDPEADSGVTLRDLLSHRTGVPDDLPAGWFERYPTHEALIRAAMGSRPAGTFRQVFHYNNYMYLAAGEALAAVHQVPFDSGMARLILGPLGMQSSTLSVVAMEAAADFSRGYGPDRDRLPTESLAFLDGIAPAGAIVSNVEDMAQWLRLMLGGGVLDGRRLVSEAGMKEILADAVRTQGGHYGLGLFNEDWHGHRLYSHPGGVLGFGSRCEFLPDQGLGWVVLTNVDDQALPKEVREIVYRSLVAPR